MIGIIYKETPFQDTGKIVYLLTSTGPVSYIARGAKKVGSRSFYYTQVLSKLAFTPEKRTITYDAQITTYAKIKANPQALAVASDILRIIDSLGSHVNDAPRFFYFCDLMLAHLNRGKDPELVLGVFLAKLTYLLGIAPLLKVCSGCGGRPTGFSLAAGGAVCGQCAEGSVLPRELLALLQAEFSVSKAQLAAFLAAGSRESEASVQAWKKFYTQYLDFRW